MGNQYIDKINDYEKQLRERMDKLIKAIHGHNAYSEDEEDHISRYSRSIDKNEVAFAIDEFQTILKAIKRKLK